MTGKMVGIVTLFVGLVVILGILEANTALAADAPSEFLDGSIIDIRGGELESSTTRLTMAATGSKSNWMTGGGNVMTTPSTASGSAPIMKVTYGFNIPCDLGSDRPAQLQVNWGEKKNRGNSHLATLVSIECTNDTISGTGTDTSGASISFTFVDGGKTDTVSLSVGPITVIGSTVRGSHKMH
jgi:hypothetical protein